MKVVGWLITILAQIVLAGVVVMLLSVVWYVETVSSLWEFIRVVFFIWLGFVVGVYGIGMGSLRMRKTTFMGARTRLFSTIVITMIPFLALLVIGMVVGPGNQPSFQVTVMEKLQPIFASFGLLAAVIGFYLPGWVKGSKCDTNTLRPFMKFIGISSGRLENSGESKSE